MLLTMTDYFISYPPPHQELDFLKNCPNMVGLFPTVFICGRHWGEKKAAVITDQDPAEE